MFRFFPRSRQLTATQHAEIMMNNKARKSLRRVAEYTAHLHTYRVAKSQGVTLVSVDW